MSNMLFHILLFCKKVYLLQSFSLFILAAVRNSFLLRRYYEASAILCTSRRHTSTNKAKEMTAD